MTYGINRKSILLELRSLHFPRSFLVDVMHCILLNVLPKILELWQGKRFEDEKKKPAKVTKIVYQQPSPPSSEAVQPLPDYVIHENKIWEAIGHIQERSRATIPSLLGQGPRRIDRHITGYKAKE